MTRRATHRPRSPRKRFATVAAAAAVLALGFSPLASAMPVTEEPTYEVVEKLDLIFANVDGVELGIDLFLPEGVEQPPVMVFMHGGGWRAGSRKNHLFKWLPEHGVALASIDYRLSQEATFPAQIHDCKAAVRHLRANAAALGIDPDRFVTAGTSAGGTLAVLTAVANQDPALEGNVGDHDDVSSAVQGVINYFGAMDFHERRKLQPGKTDHPKGPVTQLLGGPVAELGTLAKQASPTAHVDPTDPPLLIYHGLLDRTVLPRQAILLYRAYHAHGLPVEIRLDPDVGHKTSPFIQGEHRAALLAFLNGVFDDAPAENSAE